MQGLNRDSAQQMDTVATKKIEHFEERQNFLPIKIPAEFEAGVRMQQGVIQIE